MCPRWYEMNFVTNINLHCTFRESITRLQVFCVTNKNMKSVTGCPRHKLLAASIITQVLSNPRIMTRVPKEKRNRVIWCAQIKQVSKIKLSFCKFS